MSERIHEPVPAATYRAVFQDNPSGERILEELVMRHVDTEQFVPGQPDATAYNLGKKALVMEILGKLAE